MNLEVSRHLTRKQILNWGGAEVFARAEQLVRRGAVMRAERHQDILEGRIAREGASDLHTRLRILPDGSIESRCPCFINRDQGLVCPHVVALGLALLLRQTDPLREQRYLEDQRRARRIETVAPGAYLPRAPDGVAAVLRLVAPENWVACFRAGRAPLALEIEWDQQWVAPDALPRGVRLALSAADDNLLGVLEDILEGPPPACFEVAAADFLNILAVASQTRILVSGQGPLVVSAIPMRVWLEVAFDHETGELHVYPSVELPFLKVGELPVFLVCHHVGFVAGGGHVWPMQPVLPLPYHDIYRQDALIPRARVMEFIERELPALRKLSDVRMTLTEDLFVAVPGAPVFHLELAGSRASLRATLVAQYDGHRFGAAAPETQGAFSLPDPEDLFVYRTRNLPLETAAVARLLDYGFEPDSAASPADPAYVLAGSRATLNFLGSGFPSLRRSGWKVLFSGKLARLMDDLPIVTPVVQITEAGAAGFDVGFRFEEPGRGLLPPAEIQRAFNRGESFLERDGETVLLDREAIEDMRAVFEDCPSHESATSGHFRLPTLYAPFVQASLHALDGIDLEDPPAWHARAAAGNRSADARLRPVPLGALEGTLRPYQKEGVYWLRFLEASGFNGLLADEMGLGKTLQTLAWLSLSRIAPEAQGKPALIVCPTSLVENWQREAATFAPNLRCLMLAGPDRASRFPDIPGSDLVITSYALIRRDLEAYRAFRFSVVALDEAQHIKNRSTQNAVAAKQLDAVNRLVLTGTPVENSVADIWSIMDFLMPDYLGDYESFRLRYELPIAAGDRPGELAQDKLRRKLHPFLLRRVKRDVARDLPDKIVKIAYCGLTDDQQRVYNALLAESRRMLGDLVKEKGFDLARFEILALLMRLRQACCHLELLKDRPRPSAVEEPSAKLDTFLELLDEALDGGHRLLVFSQFTRLLRLVREALDARGLATCYLDGSTTDRFAQCQRFNLNREIPVFLISLKAGGTGLNLTGADMVVHFDPWWNPAVEDQATDRAHRIGQKRTVYSIKLIAEHTIEERVLAMQQRKQAVIQATVGATDEAIMRRLSLADIRDLLG